MARHQRARRGILLLIVLSLLVLFVLIGVTFVVVASQYTRASRAAARHELKGDPPIRELDDAALQLLRGTKDRNQVLFRHSLLHDVYGTDGFHGMIDQEPIFSPAQPEFITFQFADYSRTSRPSDDFYNGSVITLLGGPGKNQSARIIKYERPQPNGGHLIGRMIIERFEGMPAGWVPLRSTEFVVNGKPFNGTGDGYNPGSGANDSLGNPYGQIGGQGQGVPNALLPLYNNEIPWGEGDESWDAADYQNFFLARIPTGLKDQAGLLSGVPSVNDPLIPSFHRPFMLNHLIQKLSAVGESWINPAYLQVPDYRVDNSYNLRLWTTARPMPDNHPLFTGSNPRFARSADFDGDSIPDCLDFDNGNDGTLDVENGVLLCPLIRGPWDVDNDGDGVADSVWIDLGDPVKTAPDGRRYKALYAILCVDADGRINVNTAGSREALALLENRQIYSAPVLSPVEAGPIDNVVLGQGVGPAEIGLEKVFEGTADPLRTYAAIVTRRYQARNGIFEMPPVPGWPDYTANNPNIVTPFPGNSSILSTMQLWGIPSTYTMVLDNSVPFQDWPLTEANLLQTPIDLAGVGGVYLDHNGKPRFANFVDLSQFKASGVDGVYQPIGMQSQLNLLQLGISQTINAAQDDPYEFNLVNPSGGDSAFDEIDLEQLMRVYDAGVPKTAGPTPAPPHFPLPSTSSPPMSANPTLAQILNNNATLQLYPNDDAYIRRQKLNARRRLTTRSFDIPVLQPIVPYVDDRQALGQDIRDAYAAINVNPNVVRSTWSSTSIVELATRELFIGGFPRPTDAASQAQLNRQLQLLLPPDIRAGRRMDLNRLFGNGIDESVNNGEPGKGTADDWNEFLSYAQVVFGGTPFQAQVEFGINDPNYAFNSATSANPNPYFSRQIVARHLYCLAMLAMDRGYRIKDLSDMSDLPREVSARRLAQWAINAVEFRDRDVIMTPFEYDVEPFDEDGWSVDDNFQTVSPSEQASGDRRVVWGTEQPELLITETLAFHDRRVRDTKQEAGASQDEQDTGMVNFRFPQENQDGDMMNNITDYDASLDQYRIPQGSLYLELYAPGNSVRNVPNYAPELYVDDGTQRFKLDLGRIITDNTGSSPVWRVAIAKTPDNPDPNNWSPAERALLLPALLQDPDPTSAGAFLATVNDASWAANFGNIGLPELPSYERFIVFSNQVPTDVPPGLYFYNRGMSNGYAPPLLEPGSYGIVGPRPATAIGSMDRQTAGIQPNEASRASNQRIVLATDGIHYYDMLGNEVPLFNARPTNCVVIAAADAPAAWTQVNRTAPYGIGLSVSEPSPLGGRYYDEPTWGTGDDLDPGPRNIAEPFTYYGLSEAQYSTHDVPFDNPPDNGGGTSPLQERPETLATGTHKRFRVALLQRLADPTRSWDTISNPYITVDSQAIDLTTFNGEEDSENPPNQLWTDAMENPASNEEYDQFDNQMLRDTLSGQGVGVYRENEFVTRQRGWPQTMMTDPNVYNPISFAEPTAPTPPNNSSYWPYALQQTIGALNTTYGPPPSRKPGQGPTDPYRGAPQRPFQWLTWNNRPFVNHLELMQVPASPPWRLPFEMRRIEQLPNGLEPQDVLNAPFGHLLNFWHEDDGVGASNLNLATLLDWVDVPSPFVGTQKWITPMAPAAAITAGLADYLPPFNKLSRLREPGKVNINTIPDEAVWKAIDAKMASGNNQSVTWNDVETSLRDSGASVGSKPAFYNNPFRSAASADMMPLDSMQKDYSFDASLLRRHPSQGAGDELKLLFDSPPNANNPANDPERNSYFRYQRLQHLGNLVTTHSNVYGVWITVGYFEVHPWDVNGDGIADRDPAHPDGYQLGLEIGTETGEVDRHRGFYLIDRSIPAAYERGENHNVEDTIILRRHLE